MQGGFSLVELMVVLVILGLAASAVVLTMRAPGGSATEATARFAARAAALRDRAVVEGRPMSLWASASGYGFEVRSGAGWAALHDRMLRRADWPDGSAVSVNGAPQGRLVFDRLGLPDRAMRVDLRLGSADGAVSIDAAGNVAIGQAR